MMVNPGNIFIRKKRVKYAQAGCFAEVFEYALCYN